MIVADQQVPDDVTVTPGIGGFLTFAALALIVVLLVVSMSRHLRRIDARAAHEEAEREAAEREAAEQQGRAQADVPWGTPGDDAAVDLTEVDDVADGAEPGGGPGSPGTGTDSPDSADPERDGR